MLKWLYNITYKKNIYKIICENTYRILAAVVVFSILMYENNNYNLSGFYEIGGIGPNLYFWFFDQVQAVAVLFYLIWPFLSIQMNLQNLNLGFIVENPIEEDIIRMSYFPFDFSFFCNFIVGFASFCWLIFCLYTLVFVFFLSFFLVSSFFSAFNWLKDYTNINLIFISLINLIFFIFFFELFFVLFDITGDILKDLNTSQISWFLFFIFYFLRRALMRSEQIRNFFFNSRLFHFIKKKINILFFLYSIFSIFYFFKSCDVVDQYYSSSSFFQSLSAFSFLHFNTIFFLVLFFFYFSTCLHFDATALKKELITSVFFKLVLWSIFIGFIFNLALFLFLNFFVCSGEAGNSVSGVVIIFQGSIIVNVQKLLYVIWFSLFFFLFLILFFFCFKKCLIELSPAVILRVNFVIVTWQNAIFFESDAGLFFLFVLICWNLKFTIIFLSKASVFILESLRVFLNTKIDFSTKQLRSLFGLTFKDFFGLWDLMWSPDWVFNADRFVSEEEPISEIISTVKLKDIFVTSQTKVYMFLFGGSCASVLLPFVIPACAGINPTVDGATPINPEVGSTNRTPGNGVSSEGGNLPIADKSNTRKEVLERCKCRGVADVLFFIVGSFIIRILWALITGVDITSEDDYESWRMHIMLDAWEEEEKKRK